MRHFSLLKLLTISSFTTSSDGLQAVGPNTDATTRFGRSHRLHKSIKAKAATAALTSDETCESTNSRRRVLQTMVGGSLAFVGGPQAVKALDMDAFVNAQLESDTKNCDPKRDAKCIPKLTQDEALCKYGQSGNARGEACKRVKEAGGVLPQSNGPVKSLGGAYAM